MICSRCMSGEDSYCLFPVENGERCDECEKSLTPIRYKIEYGPTYICDGKGAFKLLKEFSQVPNSGDL